MRQPDRPTAHGFGAANVLGDKGQGFYYLRLQLVFQANSQPQDFYQARSQKQGRRQRLMPGLKRVLKRWQPRESVPQRLSRLGHL
jgi:hypothetical protein